MWGRTMGLGVEASGGGVMGTRIGETERGGCVLGRILGLRKTRRNREEGRSQKVGGENAGRRHWERRTGGTMKLMNG
jgi:hypothetical protein